MPDITLQIFTTNESVLTVSKLHFLKLGSSYKTMVQSTFQLLSAIAWNREVKTCAKTADLHFTKINLGVACQKREINFSVKEFILIPLQNEHVGMGICAKHTNFIQSGRYCTKTCIFVVFGNNNCSVSNPNDFNTHTS